MTIKINTETVLSNLLKWMRRGRWREFFEDSLNDHIHAFCELHDLDGINELAEVIDKRWVDTVYDMALMDFLSRETEDGNVVDQYLKRRDWKEKAIPKAYMKGIRNSVMSLYEVSDIRPGESFLARDLIRGGDPILVEERTATQAIVQWEHYATRIVEVRGHTILASGLLPYNPELSEKVIDQICRNAADARTEIEAMFEGHDEDSDPELNQDLARVMNLKMSAPLFSEAWLMDNLVHQANAKSRTLVNHEGHSIEFVRLSYSFAKGTTREQLQELMNDAPDMDAASPEFWNWVVSQNELSPAPDDGDGKVLFHLVLLDGDEDAVVLGTVELNGNTLEGDVNSVERADRMQRRLKEILGDLVTKPVLVHKTIEEVQAEQRNMPAPDKQQEPTPEERQILKEFLDNQYRKILDNPVSMLDNNSPRAAVKTPEGKEKVVRWLKVLEMKEARMRKADPSEIYDFTWIWQELGVAELRK